MKKDILNEAFFWKHLTDVLLEHSSIDKELFYKKIEPVKTVWDINGIENVSSEEVIRASKDKTIFVKESFTRIISDFDRLRKPK